MNEVLLAIAAGFIVGVLFSFLKLPSGTSRTVRVMGIVGVYLGELPTPGSDPLFLKHLPVLDLPGVRYL